MKFTKPEKSWILYDVANSAYTLITSATIPIWFNYLYGLSPVEGVPATTFFAFTTSIAIGIIALLSPFMGAIADHQGMKRKLFLGLIGLGGLLYTAGVFFYGSKFPYAHFVWHLFIIFAAMTHFIAIVVFL